MRTSSPFSSFAARAALVAAVVCFANAAFGQVQQPVDPKTYSSPSGTFTLTVDPSDLYGRRGAEYRLAKSGKEIWARSLPFTLIGVAITDGGVVAGYGHPRGARSGDENESEGPGELVVAIFDPAGSLRLKQVIKRWTSEDSHAAPLPVAHGLVVDEPNDRLVVRLEDFAHYESWRTYRLSTGAVLEKRTPGRWQDMAEAPMHIGDAQLIRGSPLILLGCLQTDPIGPRLGGPSILFRLVDPEAKPVWSVVRPVDFSGKEYSPDRARLEHWINAHGRILRNDQPRRWDLLLPPESRNVQRSKSDVQGQEGNARVTFAVEQTATGKWTVKEVARVPFVVPADEPTTQAKVERPPKELGTIVLGAGPTTGRSTPSAPPTHVGRLAAITIDKRGRFIAVDARNGSIDVFNAAGKLLWVGPSTPAAVQVESPELAPDDNCNLFLGLEASDDPNGKRSYAHFSADGQRLQDVLLPAPRCVFQPGTGLVVALKQSEVCLIDGSGKTVRTIQRRPDQCWLQHPHGMAVAPDGSLAVFARRLVGTDTTVSLYKTNGDPVCTIRLPESAGGFPKLAFDGRRLVVAGDNALLIYDAAGKQLVSVDPPLEIPDGAFYYPLILPGGRELALYGGGKAVLHRFEMP